MKAMVRKWGNSAAVRIPVDVLDAAHVGLDQAVDVHEEGGRIVIESQGAQARYCDTLVNRITEENRHGPVDEESALNRETDALARQLASLTGESVSEVIRGALKLRLRDEQVKRGERPWDDRAIDAIIERVNALPILDHRTADEILDYDENGLPS